MADPEVKILRDEMAKIISDNKRFLTMMSEMQLVIDHLSTINAEKDLRIKTLERQLE